MSTGKCGEHHYANIDKKKIELILQGLKDAGATVTGNNPWAVDLHKYGIKLRGTWDELKSILTIIVTAKKSYVPCKSIWGKIDELIHHISGLTSEEIA